MEPGKEYALSEFCELLDLKPTRTKELFKQLIAEGKVEIKGANRNRRYLPASSGAASGDYK